MNFNRRLMPLLFILILFPLANSHANSPDNLLPSERNTIDVFQQASPKVVFVQRLATIMNKRKREHVSDGSGSGIIWDSAGHVVTNYHVIKGADKLLVNVDDVLVSAKVVGAEPRKDIAVLHIESPKILAKLKTFKPFSLAPTHNLIVGQKAIAIGNPFGLDHTLTTGVISALGREFPGVGGVSIRDAIQTDASINPGNSGGPLLDSQGRLIGLNTAIFSQSGASAGIGFAVPADDVVRVTSQIIKHGRVILAGIGIERADSEVARRLGVTNGILIAKVLPNTPASKAGLVVTSRDRWGRTHLGDVIVSINNHDVDSYDSFYNVLNSVGVGEKISVTLLRNGKKVHRNIKTIDIAAY